MPAVAITEHGNMFSSIIFHDQARKRGINPILGCEVYVAPGDRRTKSGTPGETANHLVLLAETNEGYHNLIKLVSSGYTEGFYYKPRIDKDLLAQHATGLIGLSSCLKGEVATGIRTEQQQKALAGGRRLSRHPRAGQLLPRDAVPGHRRAEDRQHRPAADRQGPRTCRSSSPTTSTTCRTPTSSRTTSCSASAPARRSTTPSACSYHGDQFYLKTAEEMAAVFKDFPEALANTVRIAERCNVDLSGTVNHLPNFDVPAGFTLDDYFEHVVRAGLRAAAAAAEGSRRPRASSSTPSTSTSAGSPTKSR